MPINVPEFQTVNYANVLSGIEEIKGSRLRNQVLGQQADEHQNILAARERASQIRSQVDGMPGQIAALREEGMHEEADQLQKSYITTRTSGIDMIKKIRAAVDASNWKSFRSDMINSGSVDPSMLPVEYDENWFSDQEEKQKGDLKTITQRWGEEGGTMAQDIVFQDGEVLTRGNPYETDASRTSRRADAAAFRTGEWKGMAAADSNSIRSAAAELYGGFWDPESEQYRGLNRDQAQDVLSVAEEGARIYRTNNGRLSHVEAIAQAARVKKITVPQLTPDQPEDPADLFSAQP